MLNLYRAARLIDELAEHTLTSQPHCEVRRTLPVLRIAVVVVPLTVVQERKPREHAGVHVEPGGKCPPVNLHPAPVRQAMDAIRKVQPELRPDGRQCLVDAVGAALSHPAKTTRRPCPAKACGAGRPAARSIPRRPKS